MYEEIERVLSCLESLQSEMDNADGEIWHEDDSFAFGFEEGYESASERYATELDSVIIALNKLLNELRHQELQERVIVVSDNQKRLL